MPVFTFSGKDASGQKVRGERMAVNKQRWRRSCAANASLPEPCAKKAKSSRCRPLEPRK